jgi:hypothetical protein
MSANLQNGTTKISNNFLGEFAKLQIVAISCVMSSNKTPNQMQQSVVKFIA